MKTSAFSLKLNKVLQGIELLFISTIICDSFKALKIFKNDQ